jgi:hypothetical protein
MRTEDVSRKDIEVGNTFRKLKREELEAPYTRGMLKKAMENS